MKQHTPGPWEFVIDSHNHILIRNPVDSDTRTPGYFAEVRRFTLDQDVLMANANLIAAAPDLLKACNAALECVALDGDGISEPVLSQIKQAVKKATGK